MMCFSLSVGDDVDDDTDYDDSSFAFRLPQTFGVSDTWSDV